MEIIFPIIILIIIMVAVVLSVMVTINQKRKSNNVKIIIVGGQPADDNMTTGKLDLLYIEDMRDETVLSFDKNSNNKCITIELINKQTGQRIRHQLKDIIVIGREPGNTINAIQINDSRLSRQHCRIYLNKEMMIIEDLHSTNHTFVNGSQLTQAKCIQPGDKIKMGSYTYEFNFLGIHDF